MNWKADQEFLEKHAEAVRTKPRKIIQIHNAFSDNYIAALCDDGTLWYFRVPERQWYRLPSIPQSEEN
jgi:hypothetical protein